MTKISNSKDRLITLDVGGTHAYVVTKRLLSSASNSKLATISEDLGDGDGLFIDCNGEVFGHILDYLRCDRQIYPNFACRNMQMLFDYNIEEWGLKDI